ncbi:hypothetical protein AB2L28_13335 [Kineococcus sp. TBRC 1896]|uniref:Secreted protein n=1 Tax=Kineococcus mangrovi TaxID=1660183 RepID=A0ABV4I3G4_9ACTN
MVTLFLSLAVIVAVAAVVGHVCSASRPGDRVLGPPAPPRRSRTDLGVPGLVGSGDRPARSVDLRGTHRRSGR